jgi:hypothetical protein
MADEIRAHTQREGSMWVRSRAIPDWTGWALMNTTREEKKITLRFEYRMAVFIF